MSWVFPLLTWLPESQTVFFCATLEEVEDKLRNLAQPGDLLLTVGVGVFYLVDEALLS